MKWQVWLGLLISALFLFIAFRQINFASLTVALSEANYWYLIPVAILYYPIYVFRALRWRHLMKPIKLASYRNLYSATVIGFTANLLLPARLGEFVRAYQIGQKEGISKSAAFATIIVERLMDGLTILAFLAVVLILLDIPAGQEHAASLLKKAGYTSLACLAGAIFFLTLLKMRTDKVISTIGFMTRFLPGRLSKKLLGILSSFADGLGFFHGIGPVAMVGFYSILVWGISAIIVQLIGLAFGINLPLIAGIFVVVLIAFGVLVPSSPGFVGTYHVACQAAFEFFNISKEKALSMAIVMHGGFFFTTLALGLLALATAKMSFKDLRAPQEPELSR